MKKLMIGLLSVLAAFSVLGATNSPSLYNAGELGLNVSSGYSLSSLSKFQEAYSLNFAGGLFYFPYKNLGVEVNVPFYQTKGVSVSEVQADVLFRVPVGHLAVYTGLGGVYNWNSGTDWAYLAKAGAEWRFNSKWSVFSEYQYRNTDFNWGKGSGSVVAGFRLVF